MVMPDQDMEVTARIGGPKFNKEAFARNHLMGATLLLTGTGLQKSQKSIGAPPSRARAKLAPFLPQLSGTQGNSSPMSIKGLKAPIAPKDQVKQEGGSQKAHLFVNDPIRVRMLGENPDETLQGDSFMVKLPSVYLR